VQFGLATLLRLTAVAGALALIVRLVERSPTLQEQLAGPGVFYAALFSCCALAIALSEYRTDCDRSRRLRAALMVVAGLWMLQVLSALASWHAWGELVAAVHWFLVALILIPAYLCGAHRYIAAIRASVVIALLMSPLWTIHVALMVRLARARTEVSSVASYLEGERQNVGSYPADLSGYAWQRSDIQPLITYVPLDESQDRYLHYLIELDLYEGDGTKRHYSPQMGWWYYPD
jgi:hypothetical protein